MAGMGRRLRPPLFNERKDTNEDVESGHGHKGEEAGHAKGGDIHDESLRANVGDGEGGEEEFLGEVAVRAELEVDEAEEGIGDVAEGDPGVRGDGLRVGEFGEGVGAECREGEGVGRLDLKVEILAIGTEKVEGVDYLQLPGGKGGVLGELQERGEIGRWLDGVWGRSRVHVCM